MITALNIIIFVAAFYLQTDLLSRFTILGLVPNLMLVVVCAFALYGKTYESYIYAFAAGLVLDSIFGGPYGYHITVFMAIVFIASLFSKDEDVETPNTLGFVFVSVASVLFYGILWLIIGFGAKNFTLGGGLFSLEEAGITMLLGLIILPQARKLFEFENRATDARSIR